jgi:hypothetical protein
MAATETLPEEALKAEAGGQPEETPNAVAIEGEGAEGEGAEGEVEDV